MDRLWHRSAAKEQTMTAASNGPRPGTVDMKLDLDNPRRLDCAAMQMSRS